MLNILQATKDAYMCWQQIYLVGTYHECFLATLKVTEAVNIMIGRNVATANIILNEWGLDTSDSGSITEVKHEAAFAEGEKRFCAAMFFYSLLDHKYGELKDNVHNSYLAGVDIILQSYDAVLHMADGFKLTTVRQHYSGRAQKDKVGVDLSVRRRLNKRRVWQ